MHIGVAHFFTDLGPEPTEFAVVAEGQGFESVYVPEHSHIPLEPVRYPALYGGGDMPKYYTRLLDQIAVLTQIATVTSSLQLGTGVTLLAQHDPIWMAKRLATLDHLSRGRLICGVGYGWHRLEALAHGVVWSDRKDLVREKVALMRALWTQEVASFQGSLVSLKPSQAWPKPVQPPSPPVYLGAGGSQAIREAVAWADGMYVIPPAEDPFLDSMRNEIDRALIEANRDPRSFSVIAAGVRPDPRALQSYMERGFDGVTIWVSPGDRDTVLTSLARAAGALSAFRG